MESDRYTRLKALKEFGYDINWDNLKKFHIGIIGVGGLGAISAEMATRCGIGRISLFDFDIVEEVNLNRLFYKPEHVGSLKVDAAKSILNQVNPDVKIFTYGKDIMDMDFEPIFDELIQDMDIILNGVDTLPAREYLNIKCVRYKIPYINAGASRSGLSGYVHPIIPYKTACSACLKRISIKSYKDRGEPCSASLPSTMAILASIQIQEMLKYLLKFGKMIDYIMYNMLSGEFSHYKTLRDKNCPICGQDWITEEDFKESKLEKNEINELIKKLEE
jgi:ubiquitin-like modifier-activating enzyme 5